MTSNTGGAGAVYRNPPRTLLWVVLVMIGLGVITTISWGVVMIGWLLSKDLPYTETAATEFLYLGAPVNPVSDGGTLAYMIERGTALTVVRHYCLRDVQTARLIRTIVAVSNPDAGTLSLPEVDLEPPAYPTCGEHRDLLPVFASTAPGRWRYQVYFYGQVNPFRHARYLVTDVELYVQPGSLERRLDAHEAADAAMMRYLTRVDRFLRLNSDLTIMKKGKGAP